MRKYLVSWDKLREDYVIEADSVDFNSGNIVFYDKDRNVVAVFPNGVAVFPES